MEFVVLYSYFDNRFRHHDQRFLFYYLEVLFKAQQSDVAHVIRYNPYGCIILVTYRLNLGPLRNRSTMRHVISTVTSVLVHAFLQSREVGVTDDAVVKNCTICV